MITHSCSVLGSITHLRYVKSLWSEFEQTPHHTTKLISEYIDVLGVRLHRVSLTHIMYIILAWSVLASFPGSQCNGADFMGISKFPEILGKLSIHKQCVSGCFSPPMHKPGNEVCLYVCYMHEQSKNHISLITRCYACTAYVVCLTQSTYKYTYL